MALNKFYVAKVNVNQNIFSGDENVEKIIKEYIPEQILNFTEAYVGKYIAYDANTNEEVRWTLANTANFSEEYLTGYLSKSRPLAYSLITEENKIIEEQPEGKFQTESSFFVYNIEKELLIFDTNRFINRDTFIKIFKQLLEFEEGIQKIGEVEIVMKTETTELKKILFSKTITSFRVDIVHPNSRRRQFDSMKGIINDTNSKRSSFKLTNETGLKVKETEPSREEDLVPIFAESLEMSENGYAELKVEYRENGEKKTSESKATPVNIKIRDFDPQEIDAANLIEIIQNEIE